MGDHVKNDLSLRFLSWNVKGMNRPVKRSRVFSHLKQLRVDIAFLQETHLRVKDQLRVKPPWAQFYFHSNFDSRARGVAILIHKNVQFSQTKVIVDTNGRYLIIVGSINHTPVILVNVYAPNFDNLEFANNLLMQIPNLNTHLLIFGGDLNCVVNPVLDRSSARTSVPSAMSKAFCEFMSQHKYSDPWRINNPLTREYSFFSHVHHTFSRIDYFFVDGSLLPKVTNTKYLPIVISDHAPLLLDINLNSHHANRPPWRLNSLLLSDPSFCERISTSIDTFLAINKTPDTSYSLLWDTLKAYLRGYIISHTSHQNKIRRAKQTDLSNAILDIDRQYALNPSPELYKQRLDLQAEFDLLSTGVSERLLLKSRGSYYEYGDKASRLLAHQLKRQAAGRTIPQIKNLSGTVTIDPVEINTAFKSYYSSLYSSEFPPDSDNMIHFLNNLDIPNIDSTLADQLDGPITLDEVVCSIMSLQSGKAPGPDGFPPEFFKKFHIQLAPLLLSVFKESLEKGSLPPTLRQASISLLLKDGKDPDLCGSYRPLSLLNADVKVLAKLLATRIENVLPCIISEEQTGFIKGRHSFFNIRTLFNIIYSKDTCELPEVVISLDAEKAFDRVEWEYLFTVLRKFGFGETLISWIRLLYTSPLASVNTNNTRSEYFNLFRGTRQGCPLSPLLFAIAIEPLSIAVRRSTSFLGITRRGVEHRLALYADDLLLYITDPLSQLPNILSLLQNFGSFSGYKLNLQKSECLPINSKALLLSQSDLPFRLNTCSIKYLGVTVTRTLSALLDANFTPLLSYIRSAFQRWCNLPLSMLGKINAVKMNILPKFLYLFQCIPLFLPKSYFKSIDQAVISFIWSGKTPRIRKSLLQQCSLSGGLSLPNFMYYYWAANIHKLLFWVRNPQPQWCQLELMSCVSSSLPALLFSSLPTSPSRYTDNQIVCNSLKIWYQFRRHFKSYSPSTLMPITRNHLFPPSFLDAAFQLWERNGVQTLNDLYIGGVLGSFTDLSASHDLPKAHFFRYFQIRHCVLKTFPNFPTLPSKQPWEDLFKLQPNQRSLVSHIYRALLSFNTEQCSKSAAAWEQELGVEFEEDFWERAIDRVRNSSSCARLGLTQFKIVQRLHLSSSRLSKIYPDTEDICARCKGTPCHLTHMFASCPKLEHYWNSIFKILSEILGITLEPCPLVAIFGVSPTPHVLSKIQANVVAFATLLARRRILLNWKSPQPPLISVWLKDVMYFLKLEKVKFTLRGDTSRFFKHWSPFIQYFTDLQTLP